MKRLLVTGCAALALSAGTASAQTKFDITLGGDAFFAFGAISQSQDAGLRSTEFNNGFRLVVNPEAKAANGLEYGALARIRAFGPGTQISSDRAYIYAESNFGRIEGGQINGVGDQVGGLGPLDDLSPNAIGAGVDGIVAPFDGFLNGSDMGNFFGLSQLAGNPRGMGSWDYGTRITYWTPRFAGFQAGASYMPRSDSYNTGVNRVKNTASGGNATFAYDDVWEVGANYTNTFGDIGVNADVSYVGGTPRKALSTDTIHNLQSIKVGASVTYKGFKFGGSYLDLGHSGVDKTVAGNLVQNQRMYILGLAYIQDMYTVGFTYQRLEDTAATVAQGSVGGKVNFDVYTFGATYQVAPGLGVGLEYDYVTGDSNNAAALGAMGDANVVIVRTAVAF